MNLYKNLKLEPIRKEPDLWVSRLIIYERIIPTPVIIREVKLNKGLNIIWAEEPEDDDASAEINGHSAGKTTFCRFLRYVLGEKTYGTKSNTELIRKSLPNAYVAAEIFVKQKKWAVIRPIGNGRNSYTLPDATIEELLNNKIYAAYQDDYPHKIGLDALLDDFETASVVRTGEPIEWGHILSWCTRDQEARFQNIYDWRSPRSESESPVFRSPKTSPLFVMRAVLGLFLQDELKGEENLAELLKKQKSLEKELDELKREPQFRVNLYERELRRRIKNILPDEPNIETAPLRSDSLEPDLDRLAVMAKEKIESKITDLEEEQRNFQELVDSKGGDIVEKENTLKQLKTMFQLETAAKTELDPEISNRNKFRALYEEHGQGMCLLGDLLFDDCVHIKERQAVVSFTHHQDARAMQKAEAERTKCLEKIEISKTSLTKEISALKIQRDAAKKRRDSIQTDIRKHHESARDLTHALRELNNWSEKANVQNAYPKIDICKQQLDKTTKDVDALTKGLSKLLTEHDANRKLLAAIFSGSVKSVLQSGTYDGQVDFNNRELAFMITHGAAMTGEAVETLSVLLADISCLVFTTVSEKSHFPGFLLHDSPREADLGGRIYRSFIRLIASLQESFGGADNCPFQYVLTTTTDPPKELQTEEFIKMPLDAAVTKGLLLRRNLALTEGDEHPALL